MSKERKKESEKSGSPLIELRRALKGARVGEMPSFTPETLVNALDLRGQESDNQTLLERFAGKRKSSPAVFIGNLRAFIGLRKPLNNLIEATNERTANPAQEAIAQSLGAVVTRQLEREGEVCELVGYLAESSTREDIIPNEVKLMIAEPEAEN